MIKWTIRIFLILVAITVFTLFYLSFYGLETNYFNSTIQNKVKTINPNFDLEFQKTKIYLYPTRLDLVVKLQNPKILIKNNEINLSKRINSKTKTFLIHGDSDAVVSSNYLLEAKDFLMRHKVDVETKMIKNCDHHIPIEASSLALNYIKKNLII